MVPAGVGDKDLDPRNLTEDKLLQDNPAAARSHDQAVRHPPAEERGGGRWGVPCVPNLPGRAARPRKQWRVPVVASLCARGPLLCVIHPRHCRRRFYLFSRPRRSPLSQSVFGRTSRPLPALSTALCPCRCRRQLQQRLLDHVELRRQHVRGRLRPSTRGVLPRHPQSTCQPGCFARADVLTLSSVRAQVPQLAT